MSARALLSGAQSRTPRASAAAISQDKCFSASDPPADYLTISSPRLRTQRRSAETNCAPHGDLAEYIGSPGNLVHVARRDGDDRQSTTEFSSAAPPPWRSSPRCRSRQREHRLRRASTRSGQGQLAQTVGQGQPSNSVPYSKVMEITSYLTDVYGPRLTGSPKSSKAGEWAVAKMKEWGLQNVSLEPWTPCPRQPAARRRRAAGRGRRRRWRSRRRPRRLRVPARLGQREVLHGRRVTAGVPDSGHADAAGRPAPPASSAAKSCSSPRRPRRT